MGFPVLDEEIPSFCVCQKCMKNRNLRLNGNLLASISNKT